MENLHSDPIEMDEGITVEVTPVDVVYVKAGTFYHALYLDEELFEGKFGVEYVLEALTGRMILSTTIAEMGVLTFADDLKGVFPKTFAELQPYLLPDALCISALKYPEGHEGALIDPEQVDWESARLEVID